MDASLRELNVRSSALARRAEAGEVITITDRDRPIADLVPHRRGFRFARRADVVRTFEALAPVDHVRLRRDLDEVLDPVFRNPFAR